jgi:hypothetical protein
MAANDDDISITARPLALHPQKPRAEIEDEVVALIAERLRDADAELEHGMRHRQLRDCALLVGRKHWLEI